MKHDYNKILIVEDEKSLLYSMVDYFEASGFDVTYADDGKKAFELMYPDYYDCNGVQREHNKKLNNGLPILHKVPPK